MLMLPFPAPACPHTAPILAGDCGKSPLPGNSLKPARADLPQTPDRIPKPNQGGMYGCLPSPFFTHAVTPPFAARWSDTEP
jgi:hypothetical protein